MYNFKDTQRRQNQEKVIERLKVQHLKNQKDEIFEDDGEENADSKFNEMRETKTGFGAKMVGGGNYAQEGRLDQGDDDDSEGEDDEGDDNDDIGEDGEDDDDDEQSDHNF